MTRSVRHLDEAWQLTVGRESTQVKLHKGNSLQARYLGAAEVLVRSQPAQVTVLGRMFCQRGWRPEKWQSRYVIRWIRIVHGNFGKLGFFQNYPTQLNCTKEIAYSRSILKRRYTVHSTYNVGGCSQQILPIRATSWVTRSLES